MKKTTKVQGLILIRGRRRRLAHCLNYSRGQRAPQIPRISRKRGVFRMCLRHEHSNFTIPPALEDFKKRICTNSSPSLVYKKSAIAWRQLIEHRKMSVSRAQTSISIHPIELCRYLESAINVQCRQNVDLHEPWSGLWKERASYLPCLRRSRAVGYIRMLQLLLSLAAMSRV